MTLDHLPLLKDLRVSLLVENTARGAGILGEHGLCWCVRTGNSQILFDLGQGLVLESNARRMGIDLSLTDGVVFSHGHYDHVGGWLELGGRLAGTRVFLHPDALESKFQKRGDGRMDAAGLAAFPDSVLSAQVDLIQSKAPREVVSGVWMTGEIPRRHDIEDTGGDFYCGPDAERVDPLHDDQALFFRTASGVVVILGCAHAGLVNTLDYISELTGARLHAVFGGMHLLHASSERIDFTVEALRGFAPDWIGPNHCTGDRAVARLWEAFPGRVLEVHAGQSFVFPIAGSKQ